MDLSGPEGVVEIMTRMWLIGGGVFLGVLLIASLVLAFTQKEDLLPLGTAEAAVQSFLEATDAEDLQVSYDFLSDELKAECKLEDFVARRPYEIGRMEDSRVSLENTTTANEVTFVDVRISQSCKISFLNSAVPDETYVLVAELSNHTPAYLWGDAVKKLFDALDQGYTMLATMHADVPEEALDILRDYPVFIPDYQLHRIGVVVNLVLMYGEHELIRRVSGVTLVTPGPSLVLPASRSVKIPPP